MRAQPRHADRARQEQPVPRPHAWRRTSTCSAACGRASFRTARACCAPRSTWRPATSTCATRCSTASCTPAIRAPARTGRSIRATTSPTASRTRSRASRIRSARSSSRITGRSTTGSSSNLPVPSQPRQYEFARLNLTYTVLSKRVLTELVRDGHVNGWDDPRMPTLAGLRRRGVPPEAIRDFVKRIGVAKANSVVDVAMLDFSIREVLNKTALRRMAVLRPLKVVIENYPEGQSEELDAVNHPDDPAAGTRKIRFGRELYIERDDFMENPPKKFFRLSPGTEVRLRYAYFITCREVVKNASRRGGRAALHLRSGDARRQRAGRPQGARRRCIGCRPRMPCRPRCGSTIRCSPSPIRTPANFAADLNPQLAGSADRRAGSSRRWRRRQLRRAGAVRAAGLFRPRSGFHARHARCSTAPSACATPGPRWSAARADRATRSRQ